MFVQIPFCMKAKQKTNLKWSSGEPIQALLPTENQNQPFFTYATARYMVKAEQKTISF